MTKDMLKFIQSNERLQALKLEIESAVTLKMLVLAGFKFGLAIALIIVESVLKERAVLSSETQKDHICPKCGKKMTSKGWFDRSVRTLIGQVCWKRQVRRCPDGCKGVYIAPFDLELGVSPRQRYGNELKEMGCLLAVFVPYNIAASILKSLTGTEVDPVSIWNWVQWIGGQAMEDLQRELDRLKTGHLPEVEELESEIRCLPMVIGGDGVMVPFRPTKGIPDGKTVWREVKIGIISRIGHRITKTGKKVSVTARRRLTAVLGTIDELKPRLWYLSVKEGILQTDTVVWISDGGRGFWRLFNEQFAEYAQGILDFFHMCQNIWKGARDWFDGRTKKSRDWFASARHRLRSGKGNEVRDEVKKWLKNLPESDHNAMNNLVNYMETHKDHIDYDRYKASGLPIGSGMVESACKWLIQQRFKCVGMRWSEDGFNHLLHLRLAWVNGTYENLFETHTSPIK